MTTWYRNLDQFKSENGYEIDGHWYPRVTAIVSIKAKPALYKFYADQKNFAAAEHMKNQSAREGTLVHEVIEGILAGADSPIPDAVMPVVAAFQNFRNQHEIIPREIESKIISRTHGYAGTIDVLAEVDGRIGVLDIKTSKAIYRDYGIQTAAYVAALHERSSMPELTRWILRLDQSRPCLKSCGARMREKGGTETVGNGSNWKAKMCTHVWGDAKGEVELKELPNQHRDLSAFLAAKTLWEWEHDSWLRQVNATLF